ncbi:PP2C family protein-serine/threonine phosphatase [uncultured Oscillibacter sp.]|uniref:PP2C family protein-serine/threonine phosphatase n=1 Tax=uncultured Oscillibacter sp. TaxID=876091 RepID=UPI0025F6F978|nr:SpoIIE family protein phosphatase [uncultured Oscillibacter sp.]
MKKQSKVRFSLGKKLAALIILMGAVLSMTALVVSYETFSRSMMSYYNQLGGNLVRTLASQLDPAELDRYYETGEMDEDYYRTQAFIRDLVESNDVEYLYVVRPHGTGVTFLFDSDMETEESGGYADGGYCALGTYVDLVGGFAENLDRLLAGQEVEPIIQQDESFGWMMTAMTPVLHEDGTMAGYVMADISMNDVMNTRQTFLIGLLALLAGLTAAFVVGFLLILRRKVIRPIDLLTQATGAFIQNNEEELAAGTAQVNVPQIRTGDEVEQLADAFRKMEEDMLAYIRSFMAVTAEKERIGAELNVATQIQADMLPRIFPAFPARTEFDIYATMDPAKEVGGDFYDFFLVDDDHLAVVVADVSGKGVPAALFMVIAKTLIKNHAQNRETPAEVFTHTNAQLCEGNDAGLFVTAWMAVLEISTGKLTYVNAGHNPPLLQRAGGSYEWLKSRPGFVLAGMEGMRYRENEMELNPGDRLFLYTDGVTEATDANKELYGDDRLQAALDRQGNVPVRQLLTGIKESIDAFVGDAEQFDDITMLGLEYRERGERADG